MKTIRTGLLVIVLLLSASLGRAQDVLPQEREPAPAAALGAALGNLAFIPLRLGITTVGAFLGGFTGFMTVGNYEAAKDVWGLFGGQNVLTPEIIQGKESLRFSRMQLAAEEAE